MIHDDNPFVDDPAHRDPVRRFRGRLTAPVTIVTAGSDENRTGLTVSSLLIVDGDPGVVQMVVGPTSDLWDQLVETANFVIHVCEGEDRHLAEVFAGLRPSPGGVFAGVETTAGPYGPVIQRLPNRAMCRFLTREEVGYSGVVTGQVMTIEAADMSDPLIYFRGGYRSLD